MKKIEMFVITHRKLFLKVPENYKIIGVGKYGKENSKTILCDSIGENIANKNANYCELTAIYWLWKNYDLPDYIGICHYRRFFVNGIKSKIYSTNKLEEIMQKYDVILPYKVKEKPDVWGYFANSISGREKDLLSLEELIRKDYPDYYDYFEKVMHSRSASFCNMMVMKKADFNNYCSWLFELLEKYEKMVDLEDYTKQEQRIYGFMSEFLLNVWIEKESKSVKYLNSMLFTENKFKNFLKKIKIQLKNIIRRSNNNENK